MTGLAKLVRLLASHLFLLLQYFTISLFHYCTADFNDSRLQATIFLVALITEVEFVYLKKIETHWKDAGVLIL